MDDYENWKNDEKVRDGETDGVISEIDEKYEEKSRHPSLLWRIFRIPLAILFLSIVSVIARSFARSGNGLIVILAVIAIYLIVKISNWKRR